MVAEEDENAEIVRIARECKRNASKAGKAAARNMTPEARSARAKAAVAAREKKKGEPDQLTNKSEGTEV